MTKSRCQTVDGHLSGRKIDLISHAGRKLVVGETCLLSLSCLCRNSRAEAQCSLRCLLFTVSSPKDETSQNILGSSSGV